MNRIDRMVLLLALPGKGGWTGLTGFAGLKLNNCALLRRNRQHIDFIRDKLTKWILMT